MSEIVEKEGQATHAAVREHYARSAREAAELSSASGCGCGAGSAGNACCGAGAMTSEANLAQGEAAPVLASWGCGSPTAIAALRPGQVVLDLGSGGGYDAFLAARAVAPEGGATGRVIGVDMTPEMIARAWDNAVRDGYTNVDFRLGEIEDLPVTADSVDVVLSNCVINLVPDKARVFAEIFRVLKPGGRFSISDMVTYGEVPQEIREDLTLWAGCVAGALDREAYLEIIRQSGFSELHIKDFVEYDYLKGENYGLASITVQARKEKV